MRDLLYNRHEGFHIQPAFRRPRGILCWHDLRPATRIVANGHFLLGAWIRRPSLLRRLFQLLRGLR